DGAERVVVVEQRLAHAHEHHVTDAGGVDSLQARYGHELRCYLAPCEVATEAHCAGGAESAASRAADHGADAHGATTRVRHVHGLRLLAVLQREQVAHGAVVRRETLGAYEGAHPVGCRQLRAHGGGQVRHRGVVVGGLTVE